MLPLAFNQSVVSIYGVKVATKGVRFHAAVVKGEDLTIIDPAGAHYVLIRYFSFIIPFRVEFMKARQSSLPLGQSPEILTQLTADK